MKERKFISIAIFAALMVSTVLTAVGGKQIQKSIEHNEVSDNITFGVIIRVHEDKNFEEEFAQIKNLGFSRVQLSVSQYSPELAKRIRVAVEKYQVYPTTLICHGPGKYVWNFTEGPSTIGLIPREFRTDRIKRLKEGIDFSREAGIPAVHAHFGFIPENPNDTLYVEFVGVMKDLGEYALSRGVDIYLETGQETPITLLRAITDIGTGNLFINCDLANLIMYGKSNALDGFKIMEKYIKELHAKDGLYPSNPYELGKEVPIPEGEVNFPEVVAYLKKINWEGTVTIEYELAEKNYDYFIKTKTYLEELFASKN